MKYYYNPPQEWSHKGWKIYSCDHPLYNRCTLYLKGEKGLAVVQKHFNDRNKSSWWGSVDAPVAADILSQDLFDDFFEKNSGMPDENDLYPTVPLRKIMWALRMKPIKKMYWEEENFL